MMDEFSNLNFLQRLKSDCTDLQDLALVERNGFQKLALSTSVTAF